MERAVTDFIKLNESPDVPNDAEYCIFAGQNACADDALEYYKEYFKDETGKELTIFFVNPQRKRSSTRAIYKAEYRDLFNIDLKVKEVIQDSIDIVSDLNAFDKVCFASFRTSHTEKVLQLNQNAIVSMGMKDVALFKFFKLHNKKIKIMQIPLKWKGIKVLTKNLIQKANRNNLLVHVWTINDRKTINKLIDLGVNGIVTDEPELLIEIMKERDLISN